LRLPEVEKYLPTSTGELLLVNIQEWVQTIYPRRAGPARRDTDTLPPRVFSRIVRTLVFVWILITSASEPGERTFLTKDQGFVT
jgi:hypothetical protein